jgi:selenium metabolism protein YedF
MKETPMDCRGLSCPKPLMHCKQMVDELHPDSITILVDSESSLENVNRYLTSQGYAVEVLATEDHWRLTGKKSGSGQDQEQADRSQSPNSEDEDIAERKVVVLVTSETLGQGDEDLGRRLLANFLSVLPEFGPDLWRVLLLNSGVKLAVEDGPALEALLVLEQGGAKILACGTCLEHYGLMGRLVVGQTTTMLDVVTSLQLADKVLSP